MSRPIGLPPRRPVAPPVRTWVAILVLAAIAPALLGWLGMLMFLMFVLTFAVTQLRRWRRYARWQAGQARTDVWPIGLRPAPDLTRRQSEAMFRVFEQAKNGTAVLIDGGMVVGDRFVPNARLATPGEAVVLSALDAQRADPLACEPALRDPLWSDTVAQMVADRTELVGRFELTRQRVRTWESTYRHFDDYEVFNGMEESDARAELAAARNDLDDVGRELREMAGGPLLTDRSMWARVPRETVIRLARPVRAACDCRYGHYDYHAIVGARDGAATRECSVCSPPTRWVETGAGA